MMLKSIRLWRGLALVFALLFAVSLAAGSVLELYRTSVDAFFGTVSARTVTEDDGSGDNWNFVSQFKTAGEAYEGLKEFAIREARESVVLLKNSAQTLPLAADAKISMFGVRSFAPVYGGSGGSIADGFATAQITQCFQERGFRLNPELTKAYASYFADKEWVVPMFGGGLVPEYAEVTATDNPHEFSLSELAALNPDYNTAYGEYGDAAIIVVGRPAGENDVYLPGAEGLAEGVHTVTGNILSLSDEEIALVEEAKANFDKVIILLNSTNPMEIGNLKEDDGVDAILWIGFPGAYGFYAVADVLNGTVSPSGHLGDTYAKNSALAPAMRNFGYLEWTNAASFNAAAVVNSYLIEAEGIYSGYRYYETRYADIVLGNGGGTASAGTYANPDGTVSAADGVWEYANEVVYPFGYGESYTTFAQTLDNVTVSSDRKSAEVTVTTENVGAVAGKSVVQLYASVPYTEYDRENGVEKSAIQLMDYEKTGELAPGASQTITMNVDLSNLASYDAFGAGTFILDEGDYYFAIGDDAHDALNNVLAAQGKTVADGMTADGDVSKAYVWTWEGGVDSETFSTAPNGTPIVNRLTDGLYAMDYNAFEPDSVAYLSRADWDGTFPRTYSGLTPNDTLTFALNNDYYEIQTGDDVSGIVFGDDSAELDIHDLKGADFDDPRWEELLNKVTVQEYLDFAANAFHNIAAIPSVNIGQYNSDDGPNGSDSHYLSEGAYQGVPYEDAGDYTSGTRVPPSPVNLAYTWNKELAYENGALILGESTLMFNLPIMIGPGMNLHRTAWNGRGHEYYSEDPVLSGFTASNNVQGAQSKGCLVNMKHFAFNDQEANRSGIAVFMNEQKARELELRNFAQAFLRKGKPASFDDSVYGREPLGIMTSYNRIGAVPSSANEAVMVDILRDEMGFKGYNVTDFTGISLVAAPKESVLAGTSAFCGFGTTVDYWNTASLSGDAQMLAAVRQNMRYTLYALANSAALNGTNSTTHTENLPTWWRIAYRSGEGVFGAFLALSLILFAAAFLKKKEGDLPRKPDVWLLIAYTSAVVSLVLWFVSYVVYPAATVNSAYGSVFGICSAVILALFFCGLVKGKWRGLLAFAVGVLLILFFHQFAMGRVAVTADIYFIPVNHPTEENTAMTLSIAGMTALLISWLAVTLHAFTAKD